MRRHAIIAAVLTMASCKPPPPVDRDPGPALQILTEASVLRGDEPVPATSPIFSGGHVRLTMARNETLGILVYRRGGGVDTKLLLGGALVRSFNVASSHVARPSTQLYGGSRGSGDYPDVLTEAARPTSNPAYFEIHIDRRAEPGVLEGGLDVGNLVPNSGVVHVDVTISTATMPDLPVEGVWAYEDPREFAWSGLPASSLQTPSASELRCIGVFRQFGVMLSPDLPVDAWPGRRDLFTSVPAVPVVIPDDPAQAATAIGAWQAMTAPSDQRLFAIPIDEPKTADEARVARLAKAVREVGASRFRLAVTAAPDPQFGPIDLYISPFAAHLADPPGIERWTYNGKPPQAGAMVLDAREPGLRTWGWIAWRYHIPTWYVWDALYWHDRHERAKGAPLPGKPLDAKTDAVSFDDGEDHGNLDGVLAMPGDAAEPCRPTLRLAALRRGLEDRALLDAAYACDPEATSLLAARLVPKALGDAPTTGDAAWPASDAAFERARVDAISIAASCSNRLPR